MPTRLGATPFVGRDHEVAVLRALVDDAATGAGSVALIEGDAGIGKTRLLDEVLTYAKATGLRVARAAADELGRDRPFGVLADALALDPRSDDADRAQVGRWLAGEGPATGQVYDLGFRIVEAITALVEERSAGEPMAIALEDMQWADLSTLRAVRALDARLEPMPVALVLTRRPHPRSPELDRVIDGVLSRGARHVPLEPLDADESAALAAGVLDADPGPRLIGQIARTSGNPLFVVELVRSLREEGEIEVRDGIAEVGDVSLPGSLRATIRRRLSVLSAEAMEVLRVASVLGSVFAPANLSAVSGRGVAELLSVLTEAIEAGFLGERDEHLAFRHDVIREAVYADIAVPIRLQLHRHAGGALEAAGATASVVAEHLVLGARSGDAAAVRSLHRAARELAPQSASVAATVLERALALAGGGYADRTRLCSDLAYARFIGGRMADAEAVLRERLGQVSEEGERRALRAALAQVLYARGERVASLDLFALNLDAGASALHLAQAALGKPYVGDLDGAAELADEAVRRARGTNDVAAMSIATMVQSHLARWLGDVMDAVTLGERAGEPVPALEWGTWHAVHVGARYPLATACLEADLLQRADTEFRLGRRMKEHHGDIWQCCLETMGLATKHFMAGEWEDATAEAEACLSLATQTESTFVVVVFTSALAAAIHLHRGELEQAEAALARAEHEVATGGPQYGFDAMLWVRALLLEARGDSAAAATALAQVWSYFASFGFQLLHRSIAPDAVRVALSAGDRVLARSVTADMERLAGRAGVPTAQGAALRCRGLLDADGDALVAAVEAFRLGPRPFDRALACRDAAAAVGPQGRVDEAVALCEEALDIAAGLGAAREVARIEATVRGFGVRRRRRATRMRPSTGWDALTQTELRVVRLVAEGLTNRQIGERLFISRRTVETHVGHAFTKLGLSTRTELAAEVARRSG